jgi:hypothetical protein
MRILVHYKNACGNDCISKSCNTQQEADIEADRIKAAFNKRISKFYIQSTEVRFEELK